MAQQDKTTVTRQSNNKCVVRTGQTPVDGHVLTKEEQDFICLLRAAKIKPSKKELLAILEE